MTVAGGIRSFEPAGPKSDWTFGTSVDLGGALTPFSVRTTDVANFTDDVGITWLVDQRAYAPFAALNDTSRQYHPQATFTANPGETLLHPGPNGEYAVARWTAAQSGSVSVCVEFAGASGYNSSPPTTTDVHLLVGGADKGSSKLNIEGMPNTFATSLQADIAEGDVVEFVVGRGNGDYGYDSTVVQATICVE